MKNFPISQYNWRWAQCQKLLFSERVLQTSICLVTLTCVVYGCRAYLARMDGMELLDSMVRRFVKSYLHAVQERFLLMSHVSCKASDACEEKALLESFCF